jgi:hypothetical protein
MQNFHESTQVIDKLIQWAEPHDSIRAMRLTSTRAVPNASVDIFSDYDILPIVEDIHSMGSKLADQFSRSIDC